MKFRQHKFDTKISNLVTPTVFISPQALQDMWEITDLHGDEVGWLGTVTRVPQGGFLIDEVFLPKQRAHGTTTEIDPEGLVELYQSLMDDRPDGVDVVNRIRFWGHSHVNMGLAPSPQDLTTLRQLAENSEDFFLAARTLKRGEVRFDLLRADGLMVDDIPWQVYAPAESRRERWAQELKDKVEKFGYRGTTYLGSAGRVPPSAAGFGYGDGDGDYYTPHGGGRPLGGAGGGPAGRKATSAGKGSFNKTPIHIDCALNTYVDSMGRQCKIRNITDEELMLYGYELVEEEFYNQLPDRFKIDAIYDDGYKKHWVIGLDELELEDDGEEAEAGPTVAELEEIDLIEQAEAREKAKEEKKKEQVTN